MESDVFLRYTPAPKLRQNVSNSPESVILSNLLRRRVTAKEKVVVSTTNEVTGAQVPTQLSHFDPVTSPVEPVEPHPLHAPPTVDTAISAGVIEENAAKEEQATVSLSFDDVDFNDLMASSAAKAAFEKKVLDEVAKASGIDPSMVQIASIQPTAAA